jgi:hypothetical protein
MQRVCREYAESMQKVCRKYAESTKRVRREYTKSMQCAHYSTVEGSSSISISSNMSS